MKTFKLFSTKNLIRLLFASVVVLAFLAGFYQSSLEVEKRKNQFLENKLKNLNQEQPIIETDF